LQSRTYKPENITELVRPRGEDRQDYPIEVKRRNPEADELTADVVGRVC
jgi:hypothetical protein